MSSTSFRTLSSASSSSYASFSTSSSTLYTSSVATSRSSANSMKRAPNLSTPAPPAPASRPRPSSPGSSPLSMTLLEQLARLNVKAEPSDRDIDEAERLMTEARMQSTGRSWSSSLSSKDSTAAVEKISQGLVPTVTLGVVLALVETFEADVIFARRKSSSLVKAFQDKDQEDIRGQVLENAAKNCSDEVFHILAQHADAQARQEAFPNAIASGRALKVMILLAGGADASTLCMPFLKAVSSGPDELVEALLKEGGKGACQTCRNKGLVLAARLGSETKGSILLKKGADPTFEDGRALLEAMRRGVQSLAMQIVSASTNTRQRLGPQLLDTAVGQAYERKQYQLVEVCVKAGARGDMTNKALIGAIRAQQASLVDTLAHSGAYICYDKALPIQLAVQSAKPQLLMSLLHGGRSQLVPGLIGQALMDVTALRVDTKLVVEMMEMLLNANVHGDPVTKVLVQALNVQGTPTDDQSFAAMARLLCAKGKADVNVYEGICLKASIANGWIETLGVLSMFQPNLQSLQGALEPALALTNLQLRLRFIEALLKADPSGGGLSLTAFKVAAGHLLLDVLKLLAAKIKVIPDLVMLEAWKGVTAAGRELEWTQPRGLQIVHFLLHRGVSGQAVDDAFCRAVSTGRREAIELLQCCVKVPSTYSRALCGLVEVASSTFVWATEANLWLPSQLLGWGCDANSVNTALVAAVKAHVVAGGGGLETVIEVLLTENGDGGKIDLNFQHGKALRTAASAGKVSLLKMLLAAGTVQRATATQVFANVITSRLDEAVILRILDMLSELRDRKNQRVGFEVNIPAGLGQGLPPIAACLEANPGHAKLMKRLIDLGCSPDAQFSTALYGKDVRDETTTILLWACRLPNISIPVIDMLISAKVDVNFTAPASRATPLLMAAKCSRNEVVGKLLAAGAKVTVKDCEDMSPLNWSSRRGDLEAVRSLLKAGSFTNDGSIQEAARNQHAPVVAMLLKAGADVEFPSSKKGHNGRTALQELCLKGSSSPRNRDALHETFRVLHDYKCDVLKEWRGKNALFLALDSAEDPFVVTETLLDIAMWKHINDEKNIFRTDANAAGTHTCYSATAYLASSLYKYQGDRRRAHALRDLLYTKGCIDRWYEVFGPGDPDAVQNDKAVGMPLKIEEVDKRRRDKLEKRRADSIDHDAKLQRQREEADQARLIKERMHAQQVHQSDATHRMKIAQQSDVSNQQIQSLQQRQVVTSSVQKDAETNKANIAYIGAKTKEFEYQQKLDFQRREYQQKLEFQQNQKANAVAAQQRRHRLAIQ